MGALIITMGRHTVSRALKVMGPLKEGHWSNYHRIYSQARYCMWELAAVVVRQLLPLLPADQPIVLVADDTVDGKEADHVWAKGTHRHPGRPPGPPPAVAGRRARKEGQEGGCAGPAARTAYARIPGGLLVRQPPSYRELRDRAGAVARQATVGRDAHPVGVRAGGQRA